MQAVPVLSRTKAPQAADIASPSSQRASCLCRLARPDLPSLQGACGSVAAAAAAGRAPAPCRRLC